LTRASGPERLQLRRIKAARELSRAACGMNCRRVPVPVEAWLPSYVPESPCVRPTDRSFHRRRGKGRRQLTLQRPDCVAGHVRLELRNVGAKYSFERSHRFPGIRPNSDHRDYSRLSRPRRCSPHVPALGQFDSDQWFQFPGTFSSQNLFRRYYFEVHCMGGLRCERPRGCRAATRRIAGTPAGSSSMAKLRRSLTRRIR
jgi:hypothetical protein